MEFLIQFINVFFKLLTYALLARILLSWFRPDPRSAWFRFLYDTTEPILKIARKVIPPVGMIDFSPILAFIALDLIRSLLLKLLIAL